MLRDSSTSVSVTRPPDEGFINGDLADPGRRCDQRQMPRCCMAIAWTRRRSSEITEQMACDIQVDRTKTLGKAVNDCSQQAVRFRKAVLLRQESGKVSGCAECI